MSEDGAPRDSAPRPRPEYGEYADADAQATARGDSATAAELAITSEAETSVAARSVPEGGQAGDTSGVPHNLGVAAGDNAAAAPRASARVAASAPQEAQPGQQQGQPYVAATPTGGSVGGQRQSARVDRTVTVVLLVFGALGALYFATATFQLSMTLQMLGEMFRLVGFSVPQSVTTISVVGALVMLSLYAVTLIYSIQRLRANKLAFWVPLVAGVISVVALLALTMLAISQTPELFEPFVTNPDQVQLLLDAEP